MKEQTEMTVTSFALLFLALSSVLAFNVDIPSALTHRGPAGSYFGFSVDLHKDRGVNWLLVGAPTAQTEQPGVSRGGSVFRCSTEIPDQCQPIPFDVTGNNNGSGQQIDQKSDQWFGATVRSSGPNGPVLACAPRYVWFSNSYKRREPVGTCFVARESFREFSEYSPCRTSSWGYHRQGSCQAGLGATISPDGLRVFIGAVGSWYWQGQLYSINTTNPAVRSPVFRTFVTGQLFSQGLFSRLDVLSTTEGSAAEDDSYLGYSSAVGDLDDDGRTDVAVGMPRGANLTGKVVLLSSNLTNIANITGQQLGAYFGYCVAVTDVNNDGLQDVIVGAPLYSNYANTEGKYEMGRVHVYYQATRLRHSFRRSDVLDGGEVSKARFGLAVSSLGDINLDGFNDIAVGAPYDGPEERGAVYIYHGSSKGIRTKATQVVYAEEVSSELSTFGFSLAGGMDLDGNEYPDILAGAYNSDRVIFLRSRPVVYLNTVDISYDVESKQIDLENKNCSLLEGTAVACVPLTLCFEFSGRGVNNREEVMVQLILDSKSPKNPRLHFLSEENKSSLNETYQLVKGQRACRTYMVYVRPLIRDKLTPIESEVRYSLREVSADSRRTGGQRTRRSLPPVLGAEAPSKTDVIVIQKNCGPDNICIPDMQVTYKGNMDKYILGSDKKLEIEVTVLNAAEDAFEAAVYLTLPDEVKFVRVDRVEEGAPPVLCSSPSDESGQPVLRCEIGNPLAAFRTSVFTIVLQPSARLARENAAAAIAVGQKAKSSLEFILEVNSTNPEDPSQLFDNRAEISLPIRVETDLSIRGISDPEVVRFNLSAFASSSVQVKSHENQVGPQVIHIYELGNRGPSDILKANVYILWPTKTLSGKDLLYLVDRPFVDGPASCQLMEQFNPLALKLESERLSSSSSASGSGSQRSSSSSSSSSSYSSSSSSSSSSGSGSGISKSSKTTYSSSSSGSGAGANVISSSSSSTTSVDGKPKTSSTSSSWNRTSTVTRYGPDGSVVSTISTHNSGAGAPVQVIPGQIFDEEEDYDYDEELDQESTQGRRRRQVPMNWQHSNIKKNRVRNRRQNQPKELERELNCGATQCTVIKCSAGPITSNNHVVFKLRARIWAQTISEIDWEDLVISSKMVVDINELPYGIDPDYLPLRSATVTTTLDQLDREREARAIPWWIIVLAAVAGVLLLLLLIFVLWKMGFFKRSRPDKDECEQEPLKSENGHLQRDEAL
ncbi:integrin alpha-PS2-like isoform X1 [Daphnia carinata]|uniref:integrin alpha-PS2-like isoform X1 n=1 Tax=Daphnia carinata TaxID=120202 RepID=UPI00257A8A87|nr:integrin alpha-PS2-like isoform X1 [Daphnia carinata]